MEVAKEKQEKFVYTLRQIRPKPNHYKANCFNSNKDIVGCIWFELQKNKVWLHKIAVKANYRRYESNGIKHHIGSHLLAIMENFAKENNIYLVEGKFYPSAEGVRNFYEKNGYHVPNKTQDWATYDETWTLYKTLDRATKTSLTQEKTK